MSEKIIIDASSILDARILSTRYAARIISKEIAKYDSGYNISIDFKSVYQVSRSFASELLKAQNSFKQEGKNIDFVGMSDAIRTMFKIVSDKINSIAPRMINIAASQEVDLSKL